MNNNIGTDNNNNNVHMHVCLIFGLTACYWVNFLFSVLGLSVQEAVIPQVLNLVYLTNLLGLFI